MLRPWISTNLAVSADGKITSPERATSTWTSPADHARLLALRGSADALLVGRGTLANDRMTLTVPGNDRQPLRCIVSRSGNIPATHPVFRTPGGPIHLLVTGDASGPAGFPGTIHHQSIDSFLETLAAELAVKHLHCEGGGTLIRSLAEMDAIDEFHLTLAGHTVFGGVQAPTTTGVPAAYLPHSLEFRLSHFEPCPDAGECFLTYRRVCPAETAQ